MHTVGTMVVFKLLANARQLRADENCKPYRLQVASAKLVIEIV
jgi:hypothetical protein